MAWSHLTRKSVKRALDILTVQFPELYPNVAYDRTARNWNAWCTLGDGHIVGVVGLGQNAEDAAESLCIYFQELASDQQRKLS